MNVHRCHRIADRIGALLQPSLGVAVDVQRMLADALYQRDVLLVCDAHRASELADLARWFRRSAAEVTLTDRPVAPSAAARLHLSSRPAHLAHAARTELPCAIGSDSGDATCGLGSSIFDSQRDPTGPLPSPAEIVRQQLEQQRAEARRGGWLASLRSRGR